MRPWGGQRGEAGAAGGTLLPPCHRKSTAVVVAACGGDPVGYKRAKSFIIGKDKARKTAPVGDRRRRARTRPPARPCARESRGPSCAWWGGARDALFAASAGRGGDPQS